MSVSFIVGKPGGGKSMLATRVVLNELVTTDRYVVTNVPLRPKRLIEYALAKYGAHVNPARIRILNDEETKQFFLHRAGNHVAAMPPDGTNGVVDYKRCTGPDGIERDNGELLPVFYVIDEAHLHFGARDWAKTGKPAMWYLSQHRHFGDNVVFVTQSWKNVDGAFRRLAQEFTTCVNLSKRRAFGFRLPPVFMLRTFDQEPTPYATEVSSEAHRMDAEGLASCYDTAAGVGITTGLADTRDKPTGFHWGWGLACVALVLACVGLMPLLMGKGAEKFLHGATGQVKLTNAAPAVMTNTPPPRHVPAIVTNFPPSAAASGNFVTVQGAPRVQPVSYQPSSILLAETNGTRLMLTKSIDLEPTPKVKFFIRRENFVVLGLDSGDVLTVGDGRLVVAGKIAVVDGNRAYRLPE
ncbi:MAG: Zonular occludens toxin (Zot) [Limisphaerales bacterium]|nr:MAG: Zonular occludens toxin (Zot) [Limisphaerales bacterium]KAG0509178.1 MAG: Zonular occludens toxin (Zot) [Limisphaerales bacterium]TXT52482.1 MAG: Zonular occludens toxin (Zot) [Limisphaerales bacterium]